MTGAAAAPRHKQLAPAKKIFELGEYRQEEFMEPRTVRSASCWRGRPGAVLSWSVNRAGDESC